MLNALRPRANDLFKRVILGALTATKSSTLGCVEKKPLQLISGNVPLMLP